eukprot:Gb_39563 [translate_table: standard]
MIRGKSRDLNVASLKRTMLVVSSGREIMVPVSCSLSEMLHENGTSDLVKCCRDLSLRAHRHLTVPTSWLSPLSAETEREAGANKGVSDKQIRLKIFSPYVLNINLVDLPGISKVPVGDQPTDIEARIRTMILSYIKHATCIILAVSPANSDLVNSDALQMARLADPDGKCICQVHWDCRSRFSNNRRDYKGDRSSQIKFYCQLDIMDRGTDACNFLLGKVIPLRLGYFGVINRGQEKSESYHFTGGQLRGKYLTVKYPDINCPLLNQGRNQHGLSSFHT